MSKKSQPSIEMLEAVATQLKPRYLEVLVAVSQSNGNYVKAAEAIKVPVGTVKSRLHRARAAYVKLQA